MSLGQPESDELCREALGGESNFVVFSTGCDCVTRGEASETLGAMLLAVAEPEPELDYTHSSDATPEVAPPGPSTQEQSYEHNLAKALPAPPRMVFRTIPKARSFVGRFYTSVVAGRIMWCDTLEEASAP